MGFTVAVVGLFLAAMFLICAVFAAAALIVIPKLIRDDSDSDKDDYPRLPPRPYPPWPPARPPRRRDSSSEDDHNHKHCDCAPGAIHYPRPHRKCQAPHIRPQNEGQMSPNSNASPTIVPVPVPIGPRRRRMPRYDYCLECDRSEDEDPYDRDDMMVYPISTSPRDQLLANAILQQATQNAGGPWGVPTAARGNPAIDWGGSAGSPGGQFGTPARGPARLDQLTPQTLKMLIAQLEAQQRAQQAYQQPQAAPYPSPQPVGALPGPAPQQPGAQPGVMPGQPMQQPGQMPGAPPQPGAYHDPSQQQQAMAPGAAPLAAPAGADPNAQQPQQFGADGQPVGAAAGVPGQPPPGGVPGQQPAGGDPSAVGALAGGYGQPAAAEAAPTGAWPAMQQPGQPAGGAVDGFGQPVGGAAAPYGTASPGQPQPGGQFGAPAGVGAVPDTYTGAPAVTTDQLTPAQQLEVLRALDALLDQDGGEELLAAMGSPNVMDNIQKLRSRQFNRGREHPYVQKRPQSNVRMPGTWEDEPPLRDRRLAPGVGGMYPEGMFDAPPRAWAAPAGEDWRTPSYDPNMGMSRSEAKAVKAAMRMQRPYPPGSMSPAATALHDDVRSLMRRLGEPPTDDFSPQRPLAPTPPASPFPYNSGPARSPQSPHARAAAAAGRPAFYPDPSAGDPHWPRDGPRPLGDEDDAPYRSPHPHHTRHPHHPGFEGEVYPPLDHRSPRLPPPTTSSIPPILGPPTHTSSLSPVSARRSADPTTEAAAAAAVDGVLRALADRRMDRRGRESPRGRWGGDGDGVSTPRRGYGRGRRGRFSDDPPFVDDWSDDGRHDAPPWDSRGRSGRAGGLGGSVPMLPLTGGDRSGGRGRY